MILTYSLAALLLVSITSNIYLLLNRKKPQKTLDLDAKMLLRDLMNNGAMLHMKVLNAGDFFLKSPRS